MLQSSLLLKIEVVIGPLYEKFAKKLLGTDEQSKVLQSFQIV